MSAGAAIPISCARLNRRYAAAVPVFVVTVVLAACGQGSNQAAAPTPPQVTVAQPTKRTITDWDDFTGRFDAIQQVQIRARVTGFVKSIEFKDGDIVKAGDLLYVIDPRQYEAVAEQARGQLLDAQARVTLAKRELDRASSLVKTDAVSQSVVDQRTQQLRTAEAAAVQAEGTLKRAQLDVEFTQIRAPINGRISRHLVTLGNLVQGSESGATPLTSIVSMDPIYLYFDMTEAVYLKNASLWFNGKSPSSRDMSGEVQILLAGDTSPSRSGRMDFLDNRLDIGTGTLRGRAVVDNRDFSVLPGQFARVRVIGSSPYEALLLPDTAIATDQSRKIVFAVKDDDTIIAKPVVLGPLDEGLRVIKDGLKADDRVVVEGLQRVRPGAKVNPQPQARNSADSAL